MRTIRSDVNLNADDRRRIDEDWPEGADEAHVSVEDGFLCVRFVRTHRRFERIRRITGYLVGALDRRNRAKRAEERDRVRHLERERAASMPPHRTEGPAEARPEATPAEAPRREERKAAASEEAREKIRCAVGFLLCMAGLAALAWYWEGGL